MFMGRAHWGEAWCREGKAPGPAGQAECCRHAKQLGRASDAAFLRWMWKPGLEASISALSSVFTLLSSERIRRDPGWAPNGRSSVGRLPVLNHMDAHSDGLQKSYSGVVGH